MSAVKRSISGPKDLFAQADVRAEQLGYTKFSEYVQALMRADILAGNPHVREALNAHAGGILSQLHQAKKQRHAKTR